MTYFVVTGGTGFIGSALVRRLLQQEHGVVLLTRNPAKAYEWWSNSRIRILPLNSENLESIREQLDSLDIPISGVFHLAANQKYLGPKQLLYRDNVHFTEILLQWATGRKLDFFVYTSSIDAMGPNPSASQPASEEMPCRPLSAYGWSKKAAESIVSDYSGDIRTVSLRLSNVYGPGSRFIIDDIATAIRQGDSNPLVHYYHQIKNQLVHLCYVDDIVNGIYQAAFTTLRSGDVFILAGAEATDIQTLFDVVARSNAVTFKPPGKRFWRALGILFRQWYYLKIRKKADRVTYFKLGHWHVTADKARRQLLFEPQVPLATGVRETLRWSEQ